MTEAKPKYSDLTALEVRVPPSIDGTHPKLSAMVGKGSHLCLGLGRGLMSQRNQDGSIRVYLVLHVPETWSGDCGIDWSDVPTAKEQVLETYFKDWNRDAKDLVRRSEGEIRFWPLYDVAVDGLRWTHRPGLTSVGDAAHQMSPWLGEGVNLALLDSLELGTGIGAALSTASEADLDHKIDGAVERYEETMWERMEGRLVECQASRDMLFAEDSPKGFVELAKAAAQAKGAAAEGDLKDRTKGAKFADR